jgi:hypothetical protein
MTMISEAGLSTARLQEISDLAKRAGAEAVQLRIVERFLSEVERRLLKQSPVVFDIERIRTALHILKTLNEEDDVDQCLEAEFRLDQEFHLWRTLITERDQKIETYHFRRLCDSGPDPLDDEIYVALASFYRDLDFTPASQSKFDLSITRLFTHFDAEHRRAVRSTRTENVERLRNLFPRQSRSDISSDDVSYAVAAIDGFIEEAHHLGAFEDLVRSNIFDRYRVFKRELGSLFFEPEIVAAAVECNVAIGNVFDELLRTADEQLSSRLTVDIDLPSALHDPAPDSRTHISELFRVFFGEDDPIAEEAGEDADYLGKLLTFSSSKDESRQADQQPAIGPSVQSRLAPFLRTLTEARPDAELLRKQMLRSESLRSFEINDFLYNAAGSPDVLSRRALGLILWSVEFRENELRQSKELTETIQRETTSLLYKAEHLANSLQREIEAADQYNESRLRAVLNALLDSRLKLERAIVRFTNRKIAALNETTLAKPEAHSHFEAEQSESASGLFARWLMITLTLVALIGGAFYLIQQQFGYVVSPTSNIATVDVRSLPQNEFMTSAYRLDRTLFIKARDTWSQRSADERLENLRAILEERGQFRYQTIVVLSANGEVLDNVSRNGHYIDNGQSPAGK